MSGAIALGVIPVITDYNKEKQERTESVDGRRDVSFNDNPHFNLPEGCAEVLNMGYYSDRNPFVVCKEPLEIIIGPDGKRKNLTRYVTYTPKNLFNLKEGRQARDVFEYNNGRK